MPPGLEPQTLIDPVRLDGDEDLLETSHIGRRGVKHLEPKAFLIAVAMVHLEKVSREQSGLLPPGAGADLQDDRVDLRFVTGDQRILEPVDLSASGGAQLVNLGRRQLLEFRIGVRGG